MSNSVIILLIKPYLGKCTAWSNVIYGVPSVSGRKLAQGLEKQRP